MVASPPGDLPVERIVGVGVVVLSKSARVHELATSAVGPRCHTVKTTDELRAAIARVRPKTVVIDRDVESALTVVGELPNREHLTVMLVARDPLGTVPAGADAVVLEHALADALRSGTKSGRALDAPLSLDQLLGVSLLTGSLDQALEDTANLVATGFGVSRCLISLRGDSTGGAASGSSTWSSLAWSHTAERCLAALQAGATLIAPQLDDPAAPAESYLAVPLEIPAGRGGFVGIALQRPRVFPRDFLSALQGIAARLSAELVWRANHERITNELDKIMAAPGVDPLLGCWNRSALKQLATSQVSMSRRTGMPLSVAVLDVVDLQSINTRHGLDVGDRLLVRITDAVRATVREEDVVGRLGGDEIAVVMQATPADGAKRVAERLMAALADRPLELGDDEHLALRVTIGTAILDPSEGSATLLARASYAARQAQSPEHAAEEGIRSSSNTNPPRISQRMDVPELEELSASVGGTYRLLHEISRGGMGVVYRAEDRSLERPVAIKMLRPDLAEDPAVVERFRREAAMLAHIQHPNLVQIHSFGASGGDTYFVMELVEGESLEQAYVRHRTEGTMMSLVELPIVIEQIASALDSLHERGIVHRDVKPANVIRDPFRARSVLVDVGIARRYGQDAQMAGTPGFVAPEAFANEEVTARADVYGLATTAYAMLTLQRPWGEGDLVTILSRQIHEESQRISAVRPELAVLDDVLLRGMSRDPAHRQATAGQFASELATAIAEVVPRQELEPPREPVAVRTSERRSDIHEAPRTRGVVFRSVTRAIGVREAERLRDLLGGHDEELARALHDTAPLGWLPTAQLVRLFTFAPDHLGRDAASLARDIARATVRASFRRFFPASAATLVPERTLSAIRNIWGRYQTWGNISAMPVDSNQVVVRLGDPVADPVLCAWTSGLLEQLVVLSGGKGANVDHEECVVLGGDACMFRVGWQRMD
ncbi:MAG TPA: diguanylate cyclase [Kofleriaceae bacterium]|nr:diguanylate cyclase [Kofleriaceae bacterium]